MKVIAATDIETVPDVELARQINPELEDKSNEEVVEWVGTEKGRDGFPKPMFHKIISQSVSCWSKAHGFEVLLLGEMTDEGRDEESIICEFGEFLKANDGANQTQLVTFNGQLFDMPVLVQRAMKYRANLSYFWDQGKINNSVKWDNYVSRYHSAHTDLADVLTMFTMNKPKLNDLCVLSGLPGKIGVGGASVLETFNQGSFEEIDQYCEIDTVLTFLCFIIYRVTTGFDLNYANRIVDDVRSYLSDNKEDNPLYEQVLDGWNWKL